MRNAIQESIEGLFRDVIEPADFTLTSRPAWDVEETEHHFRVAVDLPGVSPDTIRVQVAENKLIVSGQRLRNFTQRDGQLRWGERYFGNFNRTFKFSTPIAAERPDATYRDGVLMLVLSKSRGQ